MATVLSDDQKRLAGWLAILGGPGLGDPGTSPQAPDARERAIAEMRDAGAGRLLPLLDAILNDPDPEARCAACEAAVLIGAQQAIELVLPLLDDPEVVVRWQACGCLHDFGDERAALPLIRVLQGDPDPAVRGTAAYALGGIGSPAAIPALLAAMESDHEFDELGHSASSCATTALDNILGTNETRIRGSDGLCQLAPWDPDLEALKKQAQEVYASWSLRHMAERGAAPDRPRE